MANEVNGRPTVDLLKPETCPKALAKFYNDAQRQAIRDAISKGWISSVVKHVKIGRTKSGTGQAERWPFVFYFAVQEQGMKILARGYGRKAVKITKAEINKLAENKRPAAIESARDGACDYFNYGWILTINQPIRIMMENSLGGVDKVVAKQVAQIVKTGIYTEEQALALVLAQREKLGLEIPDADNDDDDAENVA